MSWTEAPERSLGNAVEQRAHVFKLEEGGCAKNRNSFRKEDIARGKEEQLGTLEKKQLHKKLNVLTVPYLALQRTLTYCF